jgi:malate dehydrogenase (oxaloacetate-decarboxylating)(NADP+)
MRERNHFAAMMVNEAMLMGWLGIQEVILQWKPMLQLVDKAGALIIATTNMMMTARGPIFIRYSY